jgi:3-deoxy-D-manno-octulosonic-acid transferase
MVLSHSHNNLTRRFFDSDPMAYVIYNTLLLLATPVILCVLLAKKRCRPGLTQRFGWIPRQYNLSQSPVLWIHAVSLGEVVTIVPFVKALKERYPNWTFLVSTITETGREAVEQRLADVALHCYLPLDFPWVVEAYVRKLFGNFVRWLSCLLKLNSGRIS